MLEEGLVLPASGAEPIPPELEEDANVPETSRRECERDAALLPIAAILGLGGTHKKHEEKGGAEQKSGKNAF